MFIGRDRELKFLEKQMKSHRFEMIPIYGRRRVGKTRLLEEFTKGKKTIFYTADQFGEISNLSNLSIAINDILIHEGAHSVFPSFQTAFEAVADHAKVNSEPIVFIIDEYPYLAQTSPGVSSVLQRAIDKRYLELPNLMLILTGSQMSFMEHQVLGYQSPLYGRRTGQIKLQSLSFSEARQFLPTTNIKDFLTIYGITGGIPLYLSMMSDSLSLRENIEDHILTPNTLLYEEPRNLLLQELRTPNRYNDVLIAIAGGATRLNEIAGKTDLDLSTAIKYIEALVELDIVEKRMPIPKINKQKGIYYIKDGLFHFWYRYIPRHKNFLELGKLNYIWPRIEEDLIQFTSLIFEDFCRDWILLNSPMLLQDVGGWWGNNPLIKNAKSTAEEVDIIGIGLEKEELVVGECKWKNEKTDLSVGEKLVERANFFPYLKKDLYIFSKSEFTTGLQEYAEKHNIKLIRFEDMV